MRVGDGVEEGGERRGGWVVEVGRRWWLGDVGGRRVMGH